MSATDHRKFIFAMVSRLDSSAKFLDANTENRLDEARIQTLRNYRDLLTLPDTTSETVCRLLEDDSRSLEKELSVQLDRRRRQAIERRPLCSVRPVTSEAFSRFWQNLRAGGAIPATVGIAIVFGLLLVLPYSSPESDPSPTDTSVNPEILLASTEDIDLVENLDFYLWLAEVELPE